MTTQEREPVNFLANPNIYKLGEFDKNVRVNFVEETGNAVVALLEQARRTAQLFSHHLDEQIYNNERVVAAFSKFARDSPQTEVQILIQDAQPAVRCSHLLINLCKQLSSYIKVRRVHEDYLKTPDEFLLVDNNGFAYRKHYTSYEGVVNFHSKTKSVKLEEAFSEIWNLSEPEPEFRILHI